MMKSVSAKLTRLAADRRAFMDLVEGASPQQLQTRLRPDKWSIIEIAEHVVLAERVVLRGLPDLASPIEEFPRSLIRRAIVTAVLSSSIKVEVPSRRMRPTGTRDIAELRRMSDEAEQWLRAVAERSDLRSRALFLHPVAGGLFLAEAIWLDRAHIARHRKQIEAILAR